MEINVCTVWITRFSFEVFPSTVMHISISWKGSHILQNVFISKYILVTQKFFHGKNALLSKRVMLLNHFHLNQLD